MSRNKIVNKGVNIMRPGMVTVRSKKRIVLLAAVSGRDLDDGRDDIVDILIGHFAIDGQ